jgi:hypothetical protein
VIDSPEDLPEGESRYPLARRRPRDHERCAPGGRYIDATCPRVAYIHQLVSEAEKKGL